MNAILVKNLNKFYDNGFKALKNINLEIKKGEIFALLGHNGAGKSTLINIICGINKKKDGEIFKSHGSCWISTRRPRVSSTPFRVQKQEDFNKFDMILQCVLFFLICF